MKILCIFLVFFVCVYIKQISSKSCNNIPQIQAVWFLQCQPPCACPSPLSNFCVMDDEGECIGCAKNSYTSNCLCAGDHCRCLDGERYCNNYCVAREEICDGKCQGDDRVCKGRCIPQTATCHRFNDCLENEWKCGKKCIKRWQTCMGLCNAAEGDWKCGGICKNQADRVYWINDGKNCKAIQGNEIKPTPEILVTSSTIEATTIEDIKLPSSISIGWIIFMSLCGVLSFSLTCVLLHAILTCHKYRASEKEENNEMPNLVWMVGHIPMYCSGRMQAQINKERNDEEINNAEIEVNEAYGEAYDEEYEENEVVDYNEYYA